MGGRKPQERKHVSKRHSEQQPQTGHSKSFKKDPTLLMEVDHPERNLPTTNQAGFGTGHENTISEENTMENATDCDPEWRAKISGFTDSANVFLNECFQIGQKSHLNEKKIDSLKKELSLKAEALDSCKRFLDLEKKHSEKINTEKIKLEEEHKIGAKHLHDAKLEIGDLKKESQARQQTITQLQEEIKKLKEEKAKDCCTLAEAVQMLLPILQKNIEENQPLRLMLTSGVKQDESEK